MQNVSVIGAGTMGNGIAHVFAQKGFTVSLIDTQPQQLEKALKTISANLDRQVAKGLLTEEGKSGALKGITTFTGIGPGTAKADLVVEAATENTELKLNIFRQLDEFAPAGCILASNTSSISITKIVPIRHTTPLLRHRSSLYEPGARDEIDRGDQWICHGYDRHATNGEAGRTIG